MNTTNVRALIESFETGGHEKYEADFLNWLVENGYFTLDQEVPLDYRREISYETQDEFRRSQKYDILVFGAKIWLIEEAVSYERARYVCSLPETSGDNWFAGFAIHGQYKNIPKGEPLLKEVV